MQRRIESAWAQLAGVPNLQTRQVVVRSESMLGKRGWVAVLRIGDTLTIAVPDVALVARIEEAIAELPITPLAPEMAVAKLSHIRDVLGPASLFYPVDLVPSQAASDIVCVLRTELRDLQSTLGEDEWDESGLGDVSSQVFAVRDESGHIVSACGYERWPAEIAHLCVATAPTSRRRGHAKKAAEAAVADALSNGLLPQWRARPAESKALAQSIGFEEVGWQMSLRIEG